MRYSIESRINLHQIESSPGGATIRTDRHGPLEVLPLHRSITMARCSILHPLRRRAAPRPQVTYVTNLHHEDPCNPKAYAAALMAESQIAEGGPMIDLILSAISDMGMAAASGEPVIIIFE
jgi:hypothetical protein